MEYPGMINSSSDKKEKCTLWEEDYLATKKKKKKNSQPNKQKTLTKLIVKESFAGKKEKHI